MSELGPVSRELEGELRELARQHGVVVWLDKEGLYTEYADGLRMRAEKGEFPFPVRAWRGSFLELVLELDGLEDGVGVTPLLVHVPGHNKTELRATPLLELYRAGRVHERALPTLVREAAHTRVTVEQAEAFLAEPGLTLGRADLWLAQHMRQVGGGRDWSAHSAESIFDELQRYGELARELSDATAERELWEHLERVLGIAQGFRARCKLPMSSDATSTRDRVANMAFGLAAWALCVEFVHDLRRDPRDPWLLPVKQLIAPVVHSCQRLAVHLRTHHALEYKQLADQVEELLVKELGDATAEDLGNVDTFRFEDRKVMSAALQALGRGEYRAAHDWARARSESFWAREDLDRGRGWQLVQLAASLGLAVDENKKLLGGARSHADVLDRYAQRGYRVDGAQRRLEQARQQAVLLDIEEFAELRRQLDELRVVYRAWADELATSFNALCAAHGFLPPSSLRQREIFEDVVRPWSQQDGVTAYFTIDALRFELGHQLYEALVTTHTGDVNIKARLAELPTVTEVGMNALAPVALNGKLRLDFKGTEISGLRSLEARMADPEDRRKVMHDRVGGRTCPKLKLEQVVDQDVTSLRRSIAGARVVLVHSEGIDKAGEKGLGLIAFEHEVQKIRAAWHNLYEAGIRRFVFTADHGFLLHDAATRAAKPHGFKTTPKRRHVVSADYLDRTGKVAVRARDLEYDCDDLYFLFPEDAAPFEIGDKAKDFVHGGNSLQERVIPVITVQHRHGAGGETTRYRIEASAAEPLARMQCLRVVVLIEKDHALSFSSRDAMELAVECVDDPGVLVELCDARGAKVVGNAVLAEVEKPFEVYFRLRGSSARRVRVRLKHATGTALVEATVVEERFGVDVTRSEPPAKEAPKAQVLDAWLLELPEGGVRDVFRHIDTHRSINEAEATRMLGGARQYRQFCRDVEELMKKAPFRVQVDVSSGVKCHVRVEG
jgi:hypothetical protein